MSMTMDDSIKRWTAKRKTALVIEIIQGKTTVAEASRSFDLTPSEIEGWVEDAKRGMENSLRANPLDIREQYEKQLKDLQEAYGEAMLEIRARKKSAGPAGCGGRQMIQSIQQGLLAEGVTVSITKLCTWFGVPRRTAYYTPTKAAPKVDPRFAEPIKAMIEAEPSFGYGRAFWKRWTGYHVRSRIEAKMRCLKAFGERIAARDPDSQTAEIQIRIALMNRFSALGTAEIIRVG